MYLLKKLIKPQKSFTSNLSFPHCHKFTPRHSQPITPIPPLFITVNPNPFFPISHLPIITVNLYPLTSPLP
ncbi:hypothetical protein HanXRQr2_Chr02g0080631 [Helianthus annuus]|uniref:Uncharacterized protein n=1 Tax=Helianthus annuus TaxID=4232 RepID=A0A9K3JRJ9_HELAN|nr:hypothetical protein HanXRQr2_Chr02g0080631 [Helianthus annuus]KAJ0952938.1 hypothetical protein HanPSC8_Chr02g0078131 [Helianthus annuus]